MGNNSDGGGGSGGGATAWNVNHQSMKDNNLECKTADTVAEHGNQKQKI